MTGYDLVMAPLEKLYLARIRRALMPQAFGRVLEIGFGNGANMAYFDHSKIKSLDALDIKENMRAFSDVTYHVLSAEELPFEDASFDTVVLTLALCSVPDQLKAIREIRRVLKDDGVYLFIEHEKPRGSLTGGLVELVNPLWRRLASGCQLNLETHKKIESQGFKLSRQRRGVFHYGVAKKIDEQEG